MRAYKRYIVAFIILTMILSGIYVNDTYAASAEFVNVNAEELSGECGSDDGTLYWSLSSDGTLTISGKGAMKEYGFHNEPWKNQSSDIKKVVVEDGVTSICAYAFSYISSLEEISISDSVTSMGISMCEGCYYLAKVKLSSSCTTIPKRCFYDCRYELNSIDIPEGVTDIGEEAFMRCSYLQTVNTPQSLERILDSAFNWANNINTIEFGKNLYYIGDKAFYYSLQFHRNVVLSRSAIIAENAFESGVTSINIFCKSGTRIADTYLEGTTYSYAIGSCTYKLYNKVTFDTDGHGRLSSGEDEIKTVYGRSYGSLPSPTSDTHIFKGWYALPGDISTPSTWARAKLVTAESIEDAGADHILFAKWESISTPTPDVMPTATPDLRHKLTLSAGEHVKSVEGSGLYYTGEDVSVDIEFDEGYEFAGYAGDDYTLKSKIISITDADESLIVLAKPITYDIIYSGIYTGMTNDNPTKYTIESDDITLKDPVPYHDDKFLGWTGACGDTPTKSVTIKKGTTGDLIYEANWTFHQDSAFDKTFSAYLDTYTYVYKGSRVYPTLHVISESGEDITDNKEFYAITRTHDNEPGTATMVIDGRKRYSGCQVVINFELIPDASILPQESDEPQSTAMPITTKDPVEVPDGKLPGWGTDKDAPDNSIESPRFYFAIEYKVTVPGYENGGNVFIYNGSAIEPSLTTLGIFGSGGDANTRSLRSDEYTYRYEDNTDAGIGKVIIDGKGELTGHRVVEFPIHPLPVHAGFTTSYYQIFMGDGRVMDPGPCITYGNLKEGDDYEITVSRWDEVAKSFVEDVPSAIGSYQYHFHLINHNYCFRIDDTDVYDTTLSYDIISSDEYNNRCNHDLIYVEPKIADCDHAGMRGYYRCLFCSSFFYDEDATNKVPNGNVEAYPALGHQWGEWKVIKQATSKEDGLRERVCLRDPSHVQKETIYHVDTPAPVSVTATPDISYTQPPTASDTDTKPEQSSRPQNDTDVKSAVDITTGGITYRLSGKTATVTKGKNKKSIYIPDKIVKTNKTYTVGRILAGAFKGKKKIKKIKIAATHLTTVGKKAFTNIAKKPTIYIKKKKYKKIKKLLKKKSVGYTNKWKFKKW